MVQPSDKGMTLEGEGFDRPLAGVGLRQGALSGYVGPKVRLLWNLLNARMVAALNPFGLRPGGFSAIALLSANPGCSQNELAKGLGMDKSALVAIIDDLEGRGLVGRVRSSVDRRRHAVTLTREGEALLVTIQQALLDAGVPIRTTLSPDELKTLLSLLDRINEALAAAE